MSPTAEKCPDCQGERWVCENHPSEPWDGSDDRCCGGAGMPCPTCNDHRFNGVVENPPGWTVVCLIDDKGKQ